MLQVLELPLLAALAADVREVGPGTLGAEDHGVVLGVVATLRPGSHGHVLLAHVLRVTVVAAVRVEELAAVAGVAGVALGDDRAVGLPQGRGQEHDPRDHGEEADDAADDEYGDGHLHDGSTPGAGTIGGGVPASGAVLRARPNEKCGSVFGARLASVPMTMTGIIRKLPNMSAPPKIRIAM